MRVEFISSTTQHEQGRIMSYYARLLLDLLALRGESNGALTERLLRATAINIIAPGCASLLGGL